MGNLTCCSCGILFGVPDHWERQRREDKRDFYCPNGHRQAFVKSRADKLAEELSRERQRVAQYSDWLNDESERRKTAERQASAARGQVTRLKNRAAAGVCPCCNRTFTNLARHMAGQHPGFKAEAVDGDNIIPMRAS